MALIEHNKSPKVLKPSKHSFDFPASAVPDTPELDIDASKILEVALSRVSDYWPESGGLLESPFDSA
jgi:hypothetical protein